LAKDLKRIFANRQLRFALVGGFNTLFGLLMFFSIGLLLPTTAVENLLLAYVPSTLVGFLTQKYLVWQTSANVGKEFRKFLGLTFIQAAVNAFILWVAVDLLGQDKFTSQTLITILAVVVAYVAQRNWVFRNQQV
jgi:putative flippase GtrA